MRLWATDARRAYERVGLLPGMSRGGRIYSFCTHPRGPVVRFGMGAGGAGKVLKKANDFEAKTVKKEI